MSEISKITLPTGTSYDIKDATAREQISQIAAAGLSYTVVESLPTASASTMGVIYMVADTHSDSNDIYDEWLTLRNGTSGSYTYSWEKIGNTDVDLSNYVTDVTLNKQTATVSTGVSATTKYVGGTASGAGVAWNSKDAKTVVTGYAAPTTSGFLTAASVSTQPTITLTANTATETGRITYLQDASASASGGAVTLNTDNTLGEDTTFSVTQPTITAAESSTSTAGPAYVKSISVTNTNKLVTTSVNSASASDITVPIKNASATTVATGGTTASTSNSNILANVSVSGEVLTIGAVTLNTTSVTGVQSSTTTASKVTTSATTVATGSVSSSGTGSAVVTAVSPTTRYMTATASGGAVAANKNDVVAAGISTNVTQPTISVSKTTRYLSASASGTALSTSSGNAITALGSPSTASVIGGSSTFSVTQPTISLALADSSATGKVGVVTSAGSSGSATALINTTSLTVSK